MTGDPSPDLLVDAHGAWADRGGADVMFSLLQPQVHENPRIHPGLCSYRSSELNVAIHLMGRLKPNCRPL